MPTGKVKWYDADKGFGFIAVDDGGKDVFVHIKALERSGIKALESGQRVRVTTTQEGLYAKFFYSLDGKDYQELAEVPTNILTDEQSDGFTGAHFGMYCHDMTGGRRYADFDYFEIVKTRKEQ